MAAVEQFTVGVLQTALSKIQENLKLLEGSESQQAIGLKTVQEECGSYEDFIFKLTLQPQLHLSEHGQRTELANMRLPTGDLAEANSSAVIVALKNTEALILRIIARKALNSSFSSSTSSSSSASPSSMTSFPNLDADEIEDEQEEQQASQGNGNSGSQSTPPPSANVTPPSASVAKIFKVLTNLQLDLPEVKAIAAYTPLPAGGGTLTSNEGADKYQAKFDANGKVKIEGPKAYTDGLDAVLDVFKAAGVKAVDIDCPKTANGDPDIIRLGEVTTQAIQKGVAPIFKDENGFMSSADLLNVILESPRTGKSEGKKLAEQYVQTILNSGDDALRVELIDGLQIPVRQKIALKSCNYRTEEEIAALAKQLVAVVSASSVSNTASQQTPAQSVAVSPRSAPNPMPDSIIAPPSSSSSSASSSSSLSSPSLFSSSSPSLFSSSSPSLFSSSSASSSSSSSPTTKEKEKEKDESVTPPSDATENEERSFSSGPGSSSRGGA